MVGDSVIGESETKHLNTFYTIRHVTTKSTTICPNAETSLPPQEVSDAVTGEVVLTGACAPSAQVTSGDVLAVTRGRGVPGLRWAGPGMQLSILQGTGRPPSPKMTHGVRDAELRVR